MYSEWHLFKELHLFVIYLRFDKPASTTIDNIIKRYNETVNNILKLLLIRTNFVNTNTAYKDF